jgi:hypothetical protein
MTETSTARRRTIVAALGLMQILAWGSSFFLIAVLGKPIAADTDWSLTWVAANSGDTRKITAVAADRRSWLSALDPPYDADARPNCRRAPSRSRYSRFPNSSSDVAQLLLSAFNFQPRGDTKPMQVPPAFSNIPVVHRQIVSGFL